MAPTIELVTSPKEDQIREMFGRAVAEMDKAAETFIDGERAGDSLTTMTMLAMAMGTTFARTFMRPSVQIDGWHLGSNSRQARG